MDELLGYAPSWLMDTIVPDLRATLGNWGCFMASVLVVAVVVWFLPAYVLGWSGGDWKAWLVVGPLATIAVAVMVAGTYGLARRSRGNVSEDKANNSQDQESNDSSVARALSPGDIEELLQELQEVQGIPTSRAAP